MIFNTLWFLIFLIIIFPVFLILPSPKLRFYLVLIGSAVFHTHFAGPAGVLPVVCMGVATYGLAILISRLSAGQRKILTRKGWSVVALAIPATGLVYYKYRYFIFEQLSFLPETWLDHMEPAFSLGPLPLAISFFTFEFVHYLTDVIKGDRPVRNFLQFSLFAIFFPSIVSGPIKRYQQFVPQVANGIKRPDLETVAMGFGQALLGFGKKLIVADNAYVMVQLLEKQANWNAWSVLLLMILLSVRILFDFSGYSDIAIGIARMFGIELPKNFNFPYIARNIADFWRRWHISLSSWIRDYLYIPLGGGRVVMWRKVLNLTIVMGLCGLWHGAAWNFICWGIYHGIGLGVHTMVIQINKKHEKPKILLPGAVSWFITLVFVAYGWIIFFYPLPKVWALTACLLKF